MDKNTTAYWNLSLDTECPKCGHNFDLLCDADFWEFSGAKQACEEIKGYETCCPECNHEFKTAKKRLENLMEQWHSQEMDYFLQVFLPSFGRSIDEIAL